MALRYLRIFFGLWLGMLVLIAAFNGWIDPYDMFPSPKIQGVNANKPEADVRQRLSKAYGVSRYDPEVLILGTSRGLAIAPHHPVWEGKKVYNLALAGTSLFELYRYLQHADAQHTVKQLIWGLDWFEFADNITSPEFVDARLRVAADGSPRAFNIKQYLSDVVPSLWSFEALNASVGTWKAQAGNADLAAWAAQRHYQRVRDRGGNRAMFRDFENLVMANESFEPRRTINLSAGQGPGMKTLRAIVRYCYTHNIEAKFFISPSHARLWELWRLTGDEQTIEAWKRELVQVISDEAKALHRGEFPLWDFSGYNPVTMEKIPALGDVEQQMRWYWEDSHYTEALGYYLIDTLYAYQSRARSRIPGFGIKLTAAALDSQLRQIRMARSDYLQQAPNEIHEVEEIYSQAKAFHAQRYHKN
ncbi:MAG: hypothetical protein HY080_03305 [Gammaproteobacteria bacterium]|nr:hypothetical protein [Gammaproteobacteria bacterium]